MGGGMGGVFGEGVVNKIRVRSKLDWEEQNGGHFLHPLVFFFHSCCLSPFLFCWAWQTGLLVSVYWSGSASLLASFKWTAQLCRWAFVSKTFQHTFLLPSFSLFFSFPLSLPTSISLHLFHTTGTLPRPPRKKEIPIQRRTHTYTKSHSMYNIILTSFLEVKWWVWVIWILYFTLSCLLRYCYMICWYLASVLHQRIFLSASPMWT